MPLLEEKQKIFGRTAEIWRRWPQTSGLYYAAANGMAPLIRMWRGLDLNGGNDVRIYEEFAERLIKVVQGLRETYGQLYNIRSAQVQLWGDLIMGGLLENAENLARTIHSEIHLPEGKNAAEEKQTQTHY